MDVRDEFGDSTVEEIQNLDKMFDGINIYSGAFTTGDANKLLRHCGLDQGLEAWRRHVADFDPTSAMRRVAILGEVQAAEV